MHELVRLSSQVGLVHPHVLYVDYSKANVVCADSLQLIHVIKSTGVVELLPWCKHPPRTVETNAQRRVEGWKRPADASNDEHNTGATSVDASSWSEPARCALVQSIE